VSWFVRLADWSVSRQQCLPHDPPVLMGRRLDLVHLHRATFRLERFLAEDFDRVPLVELTLIPIPFIVELAADSDDDVILDQDPHSFVFTADIIGLNPTEASFRRADHDPSAGIMPMNAYSVSASQLAGGIELLPRSAADIFLGDIDRRLVRKL